MNHRRKNREINTATAVASLLGLALSRSTAEALRPAFVGSGSNAPHGAAKAASGAAGSVQHHCSLLPARRGGSIARAARPYGNREYARILRLRAAGYGAAFGQGDGKEKEDEEEKEEEDVAAKSKRLLQRAAAAVRTADQGQQRDQGEQEGERMRKRDVFRRRRRRANAKIQAVPVLDSSCEQTAGGGSAEAPILNFGQRGRSRNSSSGACSSGAAVDVAAAGGGHGSSKIEPKKDRRRWGPAAVGSAVFVTPVRFVRRKVDDCRSFVVSRERVHWASLAMASYIFATSVLPRLPAGTSTGGSTAGKGRSYGGYNYHDDDGEDSTLPSPELHPYDDSPAMTSRRRGGYRQRADYYHDDGGGIGTTITHLDDHAEQLWHNSPAIRAAAAAAAAAAAEAAGDSLDREAGPSTRVGAPLPSRGAAASEREAWEEDPGKEEQHRVPREPFDGSGEREGLFSDGDGLDGGSLAVDDNGVGVDPDLRTHFDLGDLELAAEKALDLLRDSGDISGGDGGDGATEPEADIDESGPELRPDLEDLELAAEKALDLLRDGGGGARGQDSAGRQDDGGTSAAAAAASVTGRSTRVPVRLSVGVDTENAAAVPAHGGAAPLSADSSQQDANRQQEQKEEEGKSSSSTGVAVVGGKEKTSGGRLTLPSPPAPAPKVPPAPAIGGSGGGGGTPGRHSTSFVAVAARAVSPAVCRIDMERLVGTRHDGSPFTDVETGQGSGLIFSSEDGLVLTNAHVVAGARKVTVTLTDGRKFLAEVKGSDALSDLAVLKIDRDASLGQTPLPEVTLGDSQELQVGDWVIAVGNPVGLDSTVTLGIVSRAGLTRKASSARHPS
ncbi:trypsin-like serine protease [Ectocarpus siliculosus]|uniref:Trypsin-like serine protease n=1 Tax=Ectocarpus siliculosus TaxID=2880 RepID=D8LTB3_ECTSI|nr:trypsin-like serine protease [Ectocarpus siliculosus]|eukprot:CBN77984.1 trypsin-like serine protease [Ectocarpus siliculosus]